jgi:predicted hydrocarbon binding protein
MVDKKEKKNQEIKTQNTGTSFFIMPAEALITLRDELSPLASELAVKAIVFRYGFRSGEACMRSMGIDNPKKGQLPKMLPDLWAEIGLGRLDLKKGRNDRFALNLYESIEAEAMGDVGQTSCDFTRGYLAGIISQLSGKSYHCKEEKCVSHGDEYCRFFLSTRGEINES